MTTPAYIYDSIRTPRGKGKKDGSLHEVKPVDLLAGLLRELQKRNDLDTARVDDIMVGCATPAGEQGGNIGALAALVADYDQCVPAVQLDRYCASSLDAVGIAAMKVMSGMEDLVVVSGVECMSRVRMFATGSAAFEDPATALKTGFIPQGLGADLLATIENISREDVDAFAMRSHHLAAKAQESGYFDRSVIPVRDENGLMILEKDEAIRPDTNMEKLGALKPSFEIVGKMGYNTVAMEKYPEVADMKYVHHAGNSSGIVDGASAMLIGNEAIGKELGLTPRGRVVSSAVISTDSTAMVKGGVPATVKALKKAGLKLGDIDLFECNEAFAVVPVWYQDVLGIDPEKVNVNGGVIGLGHPLGATGVILTGTVLDELERRKQKYGLIALCAAVGVGIAAVVENLEL